MTETELMAKAIAPPIWAVPGILPEGLCVFAAPRKLGKSCLIADIGQGVAVGARVLGVYATSEQGGCNVVHIGNEEGEYELQSRFRKLCKARGIEPSDRLHIYDRWPTVDEGGLEQLENIIKDLAPRLVTIDVLRKFQSTSGSYTQASEKMDVLADFAMRYHTAIVGVMHMYRGGISPTRGDWLDKIQGSIGITGSARTVWGLSRERDGENGVLRITGKSVSEQSIPLRWDAGQLLWTAQLEEGEEAPNSVELPISDERKQILTFVRLNAGADAPQVARGVGKSYDNVKQLLWQMVKREQLVRFGREYFTPEQAAAAADEPSPQIEFPQGARGW